MENIFESLGTEVTGELLLGREEYKKKLKKIFAKTKTNMIKSVIGLKGMGKSSVIQDIVEHSDFLENEDVLYVYEDLETPLTYVQFWKEICYTLKNELEKKNHKMDEIKALLEPIEKKSTYDDFEMMGVEIKEIFRSLKEANIKTIMVIDRFDSADKLFCNEPAYYRLLCDICTRSTYNVSAIIVSRRELYKIEGKATKECSTFAGRMETIKFEGFDDEEMKEYYKVFEDNQIELKKERKEQIEYYAGNVPFLLSLIGNGIMQKAEKAKDADKIVIEESDIKKIFDDNYSTLKEYYNTCKEQFEKDGYLEGIVSSVREFALPDETFINLGYVRMVDEKPIAISKYFGDEFLSAKMLEGGISKMIKDLERKLKLLIEIELFRIIVHCEATGNNLDELSRIIAHCEAAGNNLDEIYEFVLKKFSINSDYKKDLGKRRGKNLTENYSYFDVLVLHDLITIIEKCWNDIFHEYFTGFSCEEWMSSVSSYKDVRNDDAHPLGEGKEEIFNEREKLAIKYFCEQMFDILYKTMKTKAKPSPEECLETVKKYIQEKGARQKTIKSSETGKKKDNKKESSPTKEPLPPAPPSLYEEHLDKTLRMFMTEIDKEDEKEIVKGTIEYKPYTFHAYIPNDKLDGIDLQEIKGKKYLVKLEKVEEEPRYKVRPIIDGKGKWQTKRRKP